MRSLLNRQLNNIGLAPRTTRTPKWFAPAAITSTGILLAEEAIDDRPDSDDNGGQTLLLVIVGVLAIVLLSD